MTLHPHLKYLGLRATTDLFEYLNIEIRFRLLIQSIENLYRNLNIQLVNCFFVLMSLQRVYRILFYQLIVDHFWLEDKLLIEFGQLNTLSYLIVRVLSLLLLYNFFVVKVTFIVSTLVETCHLGHHCLRKRVAIQRRIKIVIAF